MQDRRPAGRGGEAAVYVTAGRRGQSASGLPLAGGAPLAYPYPPCVADVAELVDALDLGSS